MAQTIRQRDIELLALHNRAVSIKVELKNKRFQTIAEYQGECMSSQLDVSAESDIRRTCNLTLHVKDASYLAARDKKIWMDKYLRVSYGIYDPLAREYRFYAMGIYVLLNGSYAFDEASKTLSVSMVDLMALITQERGSAIGARKTVIEVNANIRNCLLYTSPSPRD